MIRFGCQTYSWQMSLARYQGRIDHISSVVGAAGFEGLESEMIMLGRFSSYAALSGALEPAGIQLAALTLVEDWAGDAESPSERAEADTAISLAAKFDDVLLVLCQMPGSDRADLRDRQGNVLRCLRDVGARAVEAGLVTAFHPNSPPGSVFRDADDYDVLLSGLPETVGFAPDLGHICHGGIDAVALIDGCSDRVRHVHAKDMDERGTWAPIGEGIVPVAEVTELLHRKGYEGWLVLEDESELAERDPDGATLRLGKYVDEVLRPTVAVASTCSTSPGQPRE
jgi:inosose dehydratase